VSIAMTDPDKDDALLWSYAEAARRLGVRHRSTIFRWIKDGHLKVVRFKGGAPKILAESARELIRKNMQGA
jgi:excisionase family DNA binding protein